MVRLSPIVGPPLYYKYSDIGTVHKRVERYCRRLPTPFAPFTP